MPKILIIFVFYYLGGGSTDDCRRRIVGIGDLQFADTALVIRVTLECPDVTVRHQLECYMLTPLAHKLQLLILASLASPPNKCVNAHRVWVEV